MMDSSALGMLLMVTGLVSLGLLIGVFVKSPRWTGPVPLSAAGIAVFDTVLSRDVLGTADRGVLLAVRLVELCVLSALFLSAVQQRRSERQRQR